MNNDKYRALVVDDEASIQKLMARELAKHRIDCDFASDGKQAAAMADRSRYDIIITDLRMPNMHGHALAVDILKRDEKPLLIVLTGLIEPKLATDLLARGVDDVLFKPVDFGFLAAKVKTMIERRRRDREARAVKNHEPTEQPPLEERPGLNSITMQRLNNQLAEVSIVPDLQSGS